MKKADVLDDVLDIFIRKAMEEIIPDTPYSQSIRADLDRKTRLKGHLISNKPKNIRGDVSEVYTTARIR